MWAQQSGYFLLPRRAVSGSTSHVWLDDTYILSSVECSSVELNRGLVPIKPPQSSGGRNPDPKSLTHAGASTLYMHSPPATTPPTPWSGFTHLCRVPPTYLPYDGILPVDKHRHRSKGPAQQEGTVSLQLGGGKTQPTDNVLFLSFQNG